MLPVLRALRALPKRERCRPVLTRRFAARDRFTPGLKRKRARDARALVCNIPSETFESAGSREFPAVSGRRRGYRFLRGLALAAFRARFFGFALVLAFFFGRAFTRRFGLAAGFFFRAGAA
jgi:hypothetical protein